MPTDWSDEDFQRIERHVHEAAKRRDRRDFWRTTSLVVLSAALTVLVMFFIVPRVADLLLHVFP